jgi:hypothetical protein
MLDSELLANDGIADDGLGGVAPDDLDESDDRGGISDDGKTLADAEDPDDRDNELDEWPNGGLMLPSDILLEPLLPLELEEQEELELLPGLQTL